MIKLLDILKEVQSKDLTPQEQDIVDDILGGLDEGAFDSVLEKAKKYAKKGLLTASIMAALLAAPTLTKAERGQLQALTPDTTTTRTDSSKGTFVDGVIGRFTSRFKFPRYIGPKSSEFIPDYVNISAITPQQMQEWNEFVDWMDTQGYKGDSTMDRSDKSLVVLGQYRKDNPSFWVKGPEDVKKIQSYIKIFRIDSLKKWKAGNSKIDGYEYSKITPEQRVDIESRYMPYAK
jgi:hypothetical protein